MSWNHEDSAELGTLTYRMADAAAALEIIAAFLGDATHVADPVVTVTPYPTGDFIRWFASGRFDFVRKADMLTAEIAAHSTPDADPFAEAS